MAHPERDAAIRDSFRIRKDVRSSRRFIVVAQIDDAAYTCVDQPRLANFVQLVQTIRPIQCPPAGAAPVASWIATQVGAGCVCRAEPPTGAFLLASRVSMHRAAAGVFCAVMFDLIVRGGRVIDPSQNLDTVTDVGVIGTRIAAVGAIWPSRAYAARWWMPRAAGHAWLGRSAHACVLGGGAAGRRR